MSHINNPRTFNLGGRAINIQGNARLDKLESKLKLVAAATGKSKGEIMADALEAYLPTKWAEIMKAYSEDKG